MIQSTKLLLTFSLSLLLTMFSFTSIAQDNTSNTAGFTSFAPILEKVIPSVVNIAVQGELPGKDGVDDDATAPNANPNDHNPDNNKPRKFENLGSGVIMDPKKGYVITNDHVIRHAKTIIVTLNNGRRLTAKLIGSDSETDIAVLQIKAEDLNALPMADSDKLKVGDFVVAIGNPFGLNTYGTNQTATFGMVSALQRSDLNIEGVENFIQTDAAINPGNSGGALVNVKGELVGINTAILSPSGASVGIGFAIPVNMARNIMDQIIKHGSVHHGLMGIYVQQLTPELVDAFNLSAVKGALVTQVNAGSPAERAGLKAGDIIQLINGRPVNDASQVKSIIGLLRVDSNVKMNIMRQGKPLEINATIADIKQHEDQQQAENPFLYGLALRNFDQESPSHGYIKGILVAGTSENSPGWRAGIRPGDVIIEANQNPVTNLTELQKAATKASKHDQLLVRILRGPGSLFMVILK